MNTKEIAELRRRFRADKNNITAVIGCCINEKKEIISEFNESLTLMSEDEAEKLLKLLKKVLSGSIGRNLENISFATREVAAGDCHRLLMSLREQDPMDPDKLHEFYHKIADNLAMETGYLILLAKDVYDVPYKTRDDIVLAEGSEETFRYFVCAVCPIKETKAALSYGVQENQFVQVAPGYVIAQPETGFLFPAFDSRATNLYGALYYNRSASDNHPLLAEALFNTQVIMPATEQKQTFQSILTESIGEDCSLEVVQAVQDQLSGLILEHKEQRIPEPLEISSATVQGILESCDVPEDRRDSFAAEYADAFGDDTLLSPQNLVDTKKLEITTPDVTVTVNPERSELVETRIIDGARYVLIRVENEVEVNGVTIHIS